MVSDDNSSGIAEQHRQWDVAGVEKCALQVVNLMQECIGIIRSVKEFAPPTTATAKVSLSIENVQLYTEMKNKGIVDKVIKVEALVNATLSINSTSTRQTQIMESNDDERFQLVHRILLPLVSSLSKCYEGLDQLPAAVVPPIKKQGNKKPPPPRGMLSIQNYTDIAALLEFLVCTSILPNLQNNIMIPVEDRAKYKLPKSLAGRIPQRSLMWGRSVQRTSQVLAKHLPQTVYELQETAQVLGSCILLDRFRPMLLPRHMVDVYAAVFQSEVFETHWNKQQKHEPKIDHSVQYRQLCRALFWGDSTTAIAIVDTYSHARACQALLLQGTKAPLWLRQRVSRLLTNLACRDLPAIVQVFVQEGVKDMTAASTRLAGALVTGPGNSNNTGANKKQKAAYLESLCRQLVRLLDVSVLEGSSVKVVDPSIEAGVLTVWAVLNQLPVEALMDYLLPLLSEGLVPSCESKTEKSSKRSNMNHRVGVHGTVRRIVTLLSFVPSACNPSKICRLFLCSIGAPNDANGVEMTLFGQLVRLASVHTTIIAAVKEETVLALRLLVQTISQSSFKSNNKTDWGTAKGLDIVATALVHAVAPNVWDLQGYKYLIVPSDSSEGDFDQVSIEMNNTEDLQDMHVISKQVEERTGVVVRDLVAPLSHTRDTNEANRETDESNTQQKGFDLPSRLFNLLLLVYFSTTSSGTHDDSSMGGLSPGIPPISTPVFRRNMDSFALTAMTLLPLLCEECSPQSLLLADSDGEQSGGGGVLDMIKLILDCARFSFGSHEVVEDVSSSGVSTEKTQQQESSCCAHPFSNSIAVFNELLGFAEEPEITKACGSNSDSLDGNDTLFSITSLVLSMLVALLEIGSESRTQYDEDTLKGMLPSLQSLATYREISVAGCMSDESISVAAANLAEMASHAMALISCRSVSPQTDASRPSITDISPQLRLEKILKQTEKDLKSDQPPIRARGIVALRHVARGYLTEKESDDQTPPRDAPLIEEIGEESTSVDNEDVDYAIQCILRLSILSLADSESYVFLAGVQTIVAAGDVCPRKVIPALGLAVRQGNVSFKISRDETEELELTEGQRVKVTEALLFTIRRRGPAVYEFVPLLMDLMVFGFKEPSREFLTLEQMRSARNDVRIQMETDKYFRNSRKSDETTVFDTAAELEERCIRVNTGGPVFDSEEAALVRAACISVVAELVSISHPHVVTEFCPHLVRLATNALQLDVSRPIRRSAALLSGQLYEALLREQSEAMELGMRNADNSKYSSFAIAMVSSNEEAMSSTLENCVASNDSTTKVGKDKIRAYDPATVSRCREALNRRSLAQDEGILSAAKLIFHSLQREENDPVTRMVRTHLNDTPSRNDAVRAMNGLEIDSTSLKLR